VRTRWTSSSAPAETGDLDLGPVQVPIAWVPEGEQIGPLFDPSAFDRLIESGLAALRVTMLRFAGHRSDLSRRLPRV
jgi:hypothetical protein